MYELDYDVFGVHIEGHNGFNSAGMMLVLGGGCGDQRSHESYVKNYAMVFPHDEPLAGRNMKQDPLHEVGKYFLNIYF